METPGQAARTEAAKQLVMLVFAVITIVIITAATDRDSLKRWQMRLAAVSRRLLTSLARKAGRTSMRIELTTGTQEYSIPYQLSLMRDKAKGWYDKLKEN